MTAPARAAIALCVLAALASTARAADEPLVVGTRFAHHLLRGVPPAASLDVDASHFQPDAWEGGSGHLLALVLLTVYRNTLSRSDLHLCAFEPSCSRFAQLAIDRAGTVRGILLAADRLLRDGPSAADGAYLPTGDGRRFRDPIDDYVAPEAPCRSCARP